MAKKDTNKEKMKELANLIVQDAPVPPMQERDDKRVKPVEEDKMVQFSFYLPKSLLLKVKNHALLKEKKVNKIISIALTEYLKNNSSM